MGIRVTITCSHCGIKHHNDFDIAVDAKCFCEDLNDTPLCEKCDKELRELKGKSKLKLIADVDEFLGRRGGQDGNDQG